MIYIEVWTRAFPSESAERVLMAVKNVIPFDESLDDVEISGESVKEIRVSSNRHECLIKLRDSLRSNKILDTARMLLKSNVRGDETEILLHKQAAFNGRVHLCETEEESPLGAIKVSIRVPGAINAFIDWLAPKTEKGRIVKELSTEEFLSMIRDL
jgi:predicted RNA binding protein with dsRBD fold (UPF0201 family)